MNIKRTIKKDFAYRNLGGKTITIEREVPLLDLWKLSREGNWACYNFLNRRKDVDGFFPYKIYYGHVNNLGYIISEDELEK